MKCYAMQKSKHKLSAKGKKKLQEIVNGYLAITSGFVSSEKALEIVKRSDTE